MSFTEKISLNYANKLGNKLNKDEEEIAVLNYGIFYILHTFMAILVTLITGFVFNVALEIMILSITSALLKRYSGGVHSSTPNRCILSGPILSLALALICKNILVNRNYYDLIILEIVILIISWVIIYKKCPVPSKNKPLKKTETRKKLRKKAFKLMSIYSLIIAILLIAIYVKNVHWMKTILLSMTLGIVLQICSITKVGNVLINSLDKLFDLINFK